MEYTAAAAILVLAGVGSLRIVRLVFTLGYSLYYGIVCVFSVKAVIHKLDADLQAAEQHERAAREKFDEQRAFLLAKRKRLEDLMQ